MSWLGHGRAPVVRPGQMTKEVGELSMDVERAIAPALGLVPAPAHPGPSTVFRAKLRPAMNPGHDLPRPRLHDLLTESVQAPLTLVVAPAGSGKTSLVRSWAVDTELPLAWLTLDEDDGDPAQLWRSVLAALDSLAPGCADAGRLLRGPDGVARAVRALLDDLEAREPAPRVIVLDDVHVVAEDAAAKSLAVFLQHLPAWLHVVMVGRRAPRLPVHRMRARGLLGEVHFQELRFTTEEATDLLALLAPDLAEDVAAEVVARADGWAASIRLAALAARSAVAQDRRYQPDQDDRDQLDDYVWNEVLADECDQLLEVLTATAVVERVDGDLAPVLTSREDANALLALAEERSLCVSRRESGFEVHPLVREVLARELARRAPRPDDAAARARRRLVRGPWRHGRGARPLVACRPAPGRTQAARGSRSRVARRRPRGRHRAHPRRPARERGAGRPRRHDRVRVVARAGRPAPLRRPGRPRGPAHP